jgi:(1->4)-alpha-D-glucan 1-alpha-D-glucosylmutase
MPDANDEYFIYQTLLGSYPSEEVELAGYSARIKEYIVKAVREAKVHSAWVKPDEAYEEVCLNFIDALLEDNETNQFLPSFLRFQKIIAHYGVLNSLAQVTIKMAAPGVCDFYQGSELWELSLVDPDNRRPVDFSKRMQYLHEIEKGIKEDIYSLIGRLRQEASTGKIKLFLIYQLLNRRRRFPDLFEKGEYIPLRAEGKYKECIVAFARKHQGQWAIIVTSRFSTRLIGPDAWPLGANIWDDTAVFLPEGIEGTLSDCITHQDRLTEKSLLVGRLFEHFPAAVLINTGP